MTKGRQGPDGVQGGTAAKCRTDRPWFHDGSGSDLGDVVRTMGRIQLATELKSEVVDDIVAFLHTLNGKGLKTPDRSAAGGCNTLLRRRLRG